MMATSSSLTFVSIIRREPDLIVDAHIFQSRVSYLFLRHFVTQGQQPVARNSFTYWGSGILICSSYVILCLLPTFNATFDFAQSDCLYRDMVKNVLCNNSHQLHQCATITLFVVWFEFEQWGVWMVWSAMYLQVFGPKIKASSAHGMTGAVFGPDNKKFIVGHRPSWVSEEFCHRATLHSG